MSTPQVRHNGIPLTIYNIYGKIAIPDLKTRLIKNLGVVQGLQPHGENTMKLIKLNKILLNYRQLVPTGTGVAQTDHALWMLDELESHCFDVTELGGCSDKWTIERKMRWLGFIQGYLWMTGRRTIEQMRMDCSPLSAEFETTVPVSAPNKFVSAPTLGVEPLDQVKIIPRRYPQEAVAPKR